MSKNIYDWLFGSPQESYRRARQNDASRSEGGQSRRATVQALDGPDSFILGTLREGTPLRIAPGQLQGHGVAWGANGMGKTYALSVLSAGFLPHGRVRHIDPKGESILIAAVSAASTYLALPEAEREAYASQFHVIDVAVDRVTPSNLFHLPAGMSASYLATLRAAAMIDLSDHAFSDLMHHAVYMLFAVAIVLQRGITKKFVRKFFLDDTFRQRVLAPKIYDAALRDSVEHLEAILPLVTRQSVVRQFEVLLNSQLAQISFGLSPGAVTKLGGTSDPRVTLANCGASLLVPPNVARTMAINRVVDALTEAKIRTDATPEMLVIEEIGSIIKHPMVGRYLLEGSRTARWKNLAIVCCAQDPSNAIPTEPLRALMLNARWFMAFESDREDASLLLPHLPAVSAGSEAARKQAFLAEMAQLPAQHCYFLRKGLTPLRVRTRDHVPAKGYSRDALLAIFNEQIAARSMVRIDDAERLIAEEERDLLGGDIRPQSPQIASCPAAAPLGTVEDLFALLDRAATKGEPET
ncbi:MAG TPA: hypothetical protein VNM92_05640 [Thermoanaerobaculia bacterium]|nr:hypothetical protein [Thermoanaerobaculia bacterium]